MPITELFHRAVVLTLECASKSPAGLAKTQVTDSEGLGQGPRICISNLVPRYHTLSSTGTYNTIKAAFQEIAS